MFESGHTSPHREINIPVIVPLLGGCLACGANDLKEPVWQDGTYRPSHTASHVVPPSTITLRPFQYIIKPPGDSGKNRERPPVAKIGCYHLHCKPWSDQHRTMTSGGLWLVRSSGPQRRLDSFTEQQNKTVGVPSEARAQRLSLSSHQSERDRERTQIRQQQSDWRNNVFFECFCKTFKKTKNDKKPRCHTVNSSAGYKTHQTQLPNVRLK